MIAALQQFVSALVLIYDPSSHYTTGVHILYLIAGLISSTVQVPIVIAVLLFVSILATIAFCFRRRIHTVLALVPQQFVLYLSAGGAIHAIWMAQFADGVMRSHGFLLSDQFLVGAVAFFHTWAMVLILRYGEDSR